MQNKDFDEKKPPITEIVRLLTPLANWKKLIFFLLFITFEVVNCYNSSMINSQLIVIRILIYININNNNTVVSDNIITMKTTFHLNFHC